MNLNLNHEKCLQRSRIAARRDGVNGVRMKFLRSAPRPVTCAKALGTLPRSVNEAMKLVNANTKEPLSADDVFIHYAEAANDNFLDDRFMFMHETTLRNIARAAATGIAFMNSHATGGLSAPAELPYGRTFAGRYEEVIQDDGSVRRRALFGFYMLRGVAPNGASGPTTDDLHAAIQGGTLFDVSVGLYGGQAICDVCGEDLESECGHIPGSTHGMEDEQIEAQVARGVPEGRASYTYVGGKCHEVSAVYEGAVPGAGFTKAMQSLGRLTDEERAELAESFRSLITGLKTYEAHDMAKKLKKGYAEDPDEDEKEESEIDDDGEGGEEMPDDGEGGEEEYELDEDEDEDEDDEDAESDDEDEDEDEEDAESDDEDEDEDEEDAESDDEDEDEDEEDKEGAALSARFKAILAAVGDSKVAEFRAVNAKRFGASQLDTLGEVYRKVAVGDPVFIEDLDAFCSASPDLEKIFGRTPHRAEPVARASKEKTTAESVIARLDARGITRKNTPVDKFNEEYAKETRALYREIATR